MSQPQTQLPEIDVRQPQTILVRLILLRQALRQIDDELSAYTTLISQQLRAEQKVKEEADKLLQREMEG